MPGFPGLTLMMGRTQVRTPAKSYAPLLMPLPEVCAWINWPLPKLSPLASPPPRGRSRVSRLPNSLSDGIIKDAEAIPWSQLSFFLPFMFYQFENVWHTMQRKNSKGWGHVDFSLYPPPACTPLLTWGCLSNSVSIISLLRVMRPTPRLVRNS